MTDERGRGTLNRKITLYFEKYGIYVTNVGGKKVDKILKLDIILKLKK